MIESKPQPLHDIELFPAEVISVAHARRFLRRQTAGMNDEWRAELLLSELATNAVQHARTPFTVAVLVVDTHLRVDVSDADVTHPVVRRAGADAERGRGLAMVEDLADRWGIDTRPGAKTVWFEIDLEPGLDARRP